MAGPPRLKRRRIFDAFHQSRRPEREREGWIPLAEAAEALRTIRRDTDLDRMARALGESEDILLNFWAQHVAHQGVPIHGCRMLSTRREVIPPALLLGGKIRDQATRLEVGSGEAINDFGALQVRRHDMDALLLSLGDREAPDV